MKRYNFSGCSDANCLCCSSVDESADGDYIKFSDLSVFQTWLERQIADQKSRLADATAWQESARLAYKDNKAFFGADTDRGELNAASDERRAQHNRLETLEEIMLKFKEVIYDICSN